MQDYLESLARQASEITLYDVKSAVNKAKAIVLNYTEMETKVREATNDEPWGASSTLMQEIAQGTFGFQAFNEIMPTIYQRFTDKEARQWRQIYKALVLLEYLVKNGSERVIDDVRMHLVLIKVLRNFHYIDDNGKDQGINVRNRAREIVDLLGDSERIRHERKAAKRNRNKYTGIEGGAGRYGGFGSYATSDVIDAYPGDRYGGYNGGAWGRPDGSAHTARSYGDADDVDDERDSAEFEEYDAGDDELAVPAGATQPATQPTTQASNAQPSSAQPSLFDLDDFVAAPAPAPQVAKSAQGTQAAPVTKAAPSVSDFDDFDTFVSAPAAAPAAAPPARAPVAAAPAAVAARPAAAPVSSAASTAARTPARAPAPPKDEFADLLDFVPKKTAPGSMQAMSAAKTSESLWGSSAPSGGASSGSGVSGANTNANSGSLI